MKNIINPKNIKVVKNLINTTATLLDDNKDHHSNKNNAVKKIADVVVKPANILTGLKQLIGDSLLTQLEDIFKIINDNKDNEKTSESSASTDKKTKINLDVILKKLIKIIDTISKKFQLNSITITYNRKVSLKKIDRNNSYILYLPSKLFKEKIFNKFGNFESLDNKIDMTSSAIEIKRYECDVIKKALLNEKETILDSSYSVNEITIEDNKMKRDHLQICTKDILCEKKTLNKSIEFHIQPSISIVKEHKTGSNAKLNYIIRYQYHENHFQNEKNDALNIIDKILGSSSFLLLSNKEPKLGRSGIQYKNSFGKIWTYINQAKKENIEKIDRTSLANAIDELLRVSYECASNLNTNQNFVLVETLEFQINAAICSLTKIFLYKFYREKEHFLNLIRCEWLNYGYDLTDQKTRDIFQIWLMAVQFLVISHPSYFLFTEDFLYKIKIYFSSQNHPYYPFAKLEDKKIVDTFRMLSEEIDDLTVDENNDKNTSLEFIETVMYAEKEANSNKIIDLINGHLDDLTFQPIILVKKNKNA